MPRADAWTAAQDATVRRHYGRLHPDHVLRLVNQRGPDRTHVAIRIRAHRLSAGGLPPGYGVIHDLAGNSNGASFERAVAQAKADGVHKQLPHVRGRPHIAPEAWITAYLDQALRAYDEPQQLADRGWITTAELAAQLRVPAPWIAEYGLKVRGRLGRAFRACRRHRATATVGRPLLWHPDDADQLARVHGAHIRDRYGSLRRKHTSQSRTTSGSHPTQEHPQTAPTPTSTTQTPPVPSGRV